MSDGDMWDRLFEKVDGVQSRLEPTEARARDALILATFALSLAFGQEIARSPVSARATKDTLVGGFNKFGLNKHMTEGIGSILTEMCDWAEGHGPAP